MMVYRGKLLAALRARALLADELALPPGQSSQQCLNLCNQLGRKEWVVHCCQRYEHAYRGSQATGSLYQGRSAAELAVAQRLEKSAPISLSVPSHPHNGGR